MRFMSCRANCGSACRGRFWPGAGMPAEGKRNLTLPVHSSQGKTCLAWISHHLLAVRQRRWRHAAPEWSEGEASLYFLFSLGCAVTGEEILGSFVAPLLSD